ncbi:hypothetical protein [Paenibacillus sp. RC343]|uniref:hypothetical protein n=1 Tax=Paenibacillus sp. RC343 TaxID=3045841 RepID=UPI0024BB9694|nr:hypothetical protein [Paenibacillus sp. RC343]
MNGLGGAAFPTHVMVDRHGQVREIIIGMLSEGDLERKIEFLQKKDGAFEVRIDR